MWGTGLLDDPRRRRGKLSRDIKVFCLMARAWEMINGGMQAWVGRARTADARFLRSIIDRCVSLLDSIASPFWLSIHSRSCSHILCCKASPPSFLPHISHIHPPLALTTTAHPGFSRLIPPPVCPSPASTKSAGRGFHKPLSPRFS